MRKPGWVPKGGGEVEEEAEGQEKGGRGREKERRPRRVAVGNDRASDELPVLLCE